MSLRAGTQQLAVVAGPFAVDELRLSSPAPRPSSGDLDSGRVLDNGTSGPGSYDHVLVHVSRPSWLVLGEGYNRGWRAWCDGRSLGSPAPIDGYANGWPVGVGCRHVRFAFTPNRLAEIGYVVSGIAGLVCLALFVAGVWRARRRRREVGGPAEGAAGSSALSARHAVSGPAAGAAGRPALPMRDVDPRWPPARALLVALPAAVAFGFVFGVIPGVVSVPGIVLVLWRGVGARALTLSAGGLLGVLVPVLYLARPGDEHGGNHFAYAIDHLAAHYVGVAAVGLLAAALWRTLAAVRVSIRGVAAARDRS
jgi:hypothetical protein